MPGTRVGVNSKGKKYLRGGIPGTGLYYQSSLPDAQPGQSPQSTASIPPFAILIVLLMVGFIIFAMSYSQPTTSVPVAPVPQVVAPVTVPVAYKHAVKKHRRKHVVHRAPATTSVRDER